MGSVESNSKSNGSCDTVSNTSVVPTQGSVESNSNGSCDTVSHTSMVPTQHRETLEAGDLIEIFRPKYQHWAIYVGNGYVIHLIVPSEHAKTSANSKSVINDKAIVKKELLKDVVGNNTYSINNQLDNKHVPRPLWKILKDAESFQDKELSYSVFTYNCEHFVTQLRYGKAESQQVSEYADKLKAWVIFNMAPSFTVSTASEEKSIH